MGFTQKDIIRQRKFGVKLGAGDETCLRDMPYTSGKRVVSEMFCLPRRCLIAGDEQQKYCEERYHKASSRHGLEIIED